MSRLKTLLIYVLILVGFIIFSEFLINVSLNSSYHQIGRKDNLEQVTVYQAEATKVNARIKGTITDKEENPINKKYVRIDIYSERDINVGTKYIDIENLEVGNNQEFALYFKAEDVGYYEISYTDQKSTEDLELLPEDLTKQQIVIATIFTMLIFW